MERFCYQCSKGKSQSVIPDRSTAPTERSQCSYCESEIPKSAEVLDKPGLCWRCSALKFKCGKCSKKAGRDVQKSIHAFHLERLLAWRSMRYLTSRHSAEAATRKEVCSHVRKQLHTSVARAVSISLHKTSTSRSCKRSKKPTLCVWRDVNTAQIHLRILRPPKLKLCSAKNANNSSHSRSLVQPDKDAVICESGYVGSASTNLAPSVAPHDQLRRSVHIRVQRAFIHPVQDAVSQDSRGQKIMSTASRNGHAPIAKRKTSCKKELKSSRSIALHTTKIQSKAAC